MTLGEYIRQYRNRVGISQDTFAQISGISKGYIATLELNKNTTSGKEPSPTLDTYYKVAYASGISPIELIRSLEGEVLINSPYTFEEQMIIYTYRKATEKEKGTIHNILDPYLNVNKKPSSEDTPSAGSSSSAKAG